jgi:hypothetical protein
MFQKYVIYVAYREGRNETKHGRGRAWWGSNAKDEGAVEQEVVR